MCNRLQVDSESNESVFGVVQFSNVITADLSSPTDMHVATFLLFCDNSLNSSSAGNLWVDTALVLNFFGNCVFFSSKHLHVFIRFKKVLFHSLFISVDYLRFN